MSAFARFLHPPFVARRAYSSFFSSKPGGGGGRYFNSAKPPKAVVSGGTAKNKGVQPESSADASSDGAANGGNGPNQLINSNADQPAQVSNSSSSSSSATNNGTNPDAPEVNNSLPRVFGQEAQHHHVHRQHPVITSKDFKLHQFFSLHRPLLLLAQPSAIFISTSPNVDPTSVKPNSSSNHPWLLDEFSEASMDADAAAARQLTRALTINHAGATVAWEDTLRRLGLDVSKDADRVGLQQQWDREWQEVMMDSTKRKRRKKMKKHKLKKRRKATRAARVKIGR